MQSTFCLVLPGDSVTSRRLFDAIVAGCVPVIVTGVDITEFYNGTGRISQQKRFEETRRSLPFAVREALVEGLSVLRSPLL